MSTYDQVVHKAALSPVARTDGAVNGTAVDRAINGGMLDAVLVIQTGVMTDGSVAITIEDSDNGSTGWAAVSAGQLQGALPTVTATDDGAIFEVGLLASRRYVRAVATTSGSTTGGVFGASWALGSPRFGPVTHP